MSTHKLAVSKQIIYSFLIDFTHDVSIEMSPEVPVAGERFSLICRVRSDLPATLSWRGPSGKASEMTVYGGTSTISLNFDSLKMSSSGKYECLSEIDFHYTDKFSSNAMQLQVVGKLIHRKQCA